MIGGDHIRAGTLRALRQFSTIDRKVTVEALILGAGCSIIVALAARFQPISAFTGHSWTSSAARSEALMAAVIAIPIATALFARRRYTDLVEARRELVRLALHDPLTGLPNRRLLGEWLEEDITRSQATGTQAAVLFIDLDRLKYVNDTHGHEIGDRLMGAVAERLVGVVGDAGRVLRYGGDEFVILCPGITSPSVASSLARQAIEAIERPFSVGGESLRISACVGIALAEHRGVRPDDVIHDADVAMYQAKARGSGRVVVFDRSMAGSLTPASAEQLIRAALDNGEFVLHYQPVVDLSSGRIVGAEALLRWVSAERGTMSPAEFIPILEETGLIVPVGTWVLEQGCRQAIRINDLLPEDGYITITVNVSARQISQVDFDSVVAAALAKTGVTPSHLHLEITEGALMHDLDSAWAMLRRAKATGVKLALDDFGTGYSSLTYVRRFNLDMLKIDKSFIDGVDSNAEDRAIVRHIVGMADTLGMATVAEGVERPEQLAWLRRLGCQLAQGFALARPMPAPELEAMVLERLHRPFSFNADVHVPSGPGVGEMSTGESMAEASPSPSLPARTPKLAPAVAEAYIDLTTPSADASRGGGGDDTRGLAVAQARRTAPRLPRFREFHERDPSTDHLV